VLTVTATLAKAQPWAARGFEAARVQVPVPGARSRGAAPAALRLVRGAPPTPPSEVAEALAAACSVDRVDLTLWRAPIDNDGLKLAEFQELKPLGLWRAAGLDTLERHTVLVDTRRRARGQTTVRREWRGTNAVVTEHAVWRQGSDGSVIVAEDIVIPDEITDVARVGMRWSLPTVFERVTWYGLGPGESYPDRRRGVQLGRFTQSVADQYVPYVMPQEHGGHADTRWGIAHTVDGWGLLVTAATPFQWNVSGYTPEQLTAATHAEDLVPDDVVTMHLDAHHRGLGTLSCGPDTLPEYRIGPGRYRFTWAARAVHLRHDDVAALARTLRAECARRH